MCLLFDVCFEFCLIFGLALLAQLSSETDLSLSFCLCGTARWGLVNTPFRSSLQSFQREHSGLPYTRGVSGYPYLNKLSLKVCL